MRQIAIALVCVGSSLAFAGCVADQGTPPGDDAAMDGSVSDGSAHVDAPGAPDTSVDARLAVDANTDAGPVPCMHDSDCVAPDLCHIARCTTGTCAITAVTCNDGNACTQDVCDSATGNCSNPPATDGTTCATGMCCGGTCLGTATDPNHCGSCGHVCGSNATCAAGTCACNTGFLDCDSTPGCEVSSGSDASHCGACTTTCSAPTPTCLNGTCGACTVPSDCPDDGLACTGAPTCNSGTCNYPLTTGCLIAGGCVASNAADPTNSCRWCDPSMSTAAYVVHNAATCDDGSYCTTGDVCNAGGSCVGSPRNCDDSLSCTADTCNDAMARCDHAVQPGSCAIGGSCYLQAAGNPASPQCQVCDPTMSSSMWTTLTSQSCDDGLYCTVADSCNASGLCRGLARSCDDLLACTTDSCSEAMMACTHVATAGHCFINGVCYANGDPNPTNQCLICNPALATQTWSVNLGAACDDGDYCTVADGCTGTAVCFGQPRTCNDGLSCTTDTCDSVNMRCNFVPQMDYCLINGSCYANAQVHPTNQCLACISPTSNSAWSPRTGAVCTDSLFCTVNDQCTSSPSGVCTGTARDCSDASTCTVDTCNEGTMMCDHTTTAMTCNIGGSCYGSGVRNPANQCQACVPASSTSAFTTTTGASCSDGLYCTSGDQCSSSATCVGGSPVNCDDGLTCTMDSCSEAMMGACVHTLAGGFCAIGGACYASGTPNPANPCQVCTPATSTTAWSARAGSCDDNNYCTTGDACSMGSCVGTPRNCADALSCTTDSCMQTGAGTGMCVNALQAGFCDISGACYADQTANPANACQVCLVVNSTSNWSAWPTPSSHRCDDGAVASCGLCTMMGTCMPQSPCGADGYACTTDTCVDANGTCTYPLNNGGCLISGTCYANGAVNATNPCQTCNPAVNAYAWTSSARPGYCLIGSSCYANGTTLNNGCESCNTAVSQTAFTYAARGQSCDATSDSACYQCDGAGVCANSLNCSDSYACTTDTCNAAGGTWPGTCSYPIVSNQCLITGNCYLSGAHLSSSYGCQTCIPTTSHTAWTDEPSGTFCSIPGDTARMCDSCNGTGACIRHHTCPLNYFCDDSGTGTYTCSM